MRVAVCVIARMEGKYIKEFIQDYKNLGFSNIIFCDNDHDGDDEDIVSIIKDYIDDGFVIYEDCRNLVNSQVKVYTKMYKKYGNDFDWLLMIDADEFLTFTKDKNVSEFLSKFPSDCEVVVANWAQYGDNGHIYADYSKPLKERFTEARPNARSQYDFVDDCHIKSFVRGGLPYVVWYSNPHIHTKPVVC